MNDWTHLKKSFTQNQEDAIWQYFIDHSKIQPNGYLGIMFYVKDVDDFWKRVYARYTGDFKRYDKLEKQMRQDSIAFSIMKADSRRKSKVTDRIDSDGTLKEKMILWLYRKTRDILFRKI
jgi:hypothetical protein